ncbi:MAG TPA: acetate uptake transporter [Candidatus Acidoferrales bacterium]|nr:acetate uptake transporter [Candidatus Acidoferrales bacterium]
MAEARPGQNLTERPVAAAVPTIANPAALGLAGFGLTTFVLSVHNANLAHDLTWVGLAFFYGGLAQFCAGMWEFRAGNTFGATAFASYGAFWLALASFVLLVLMGKVPANEISNDLGWFLLSFAIFNTYMMFWSLRINVGVFLVFLTLEVTEILLFIGNFNGDKPGQGLVGLGGWIGILTAIVAWYVSAAIVANSTRPRPILPLGAPFWS